MSQQTHFGSLVTEEISGSGNHDRPVGVQINMEKERRGVTDTTPVARVEEMPDPHDASRLILRVRVWPDGWNGPPRDMVVAQMAARHNNDFSATEKPLRSHDLLGVYKGLAFPLAVQHSAGKHAHMTYPVFFHETEDYTLSLLRANLDQESDTWYNSYQLIAKARGGAVLHVDADFSATLPLPDGGGALRCTFHPQEEARALPLSSHGLGTERLDHLGVGTITLGRHIQTADGLSYFSPQDWRTTPERGEDERRMQLTYLEHRAWDTVLQYELRDQSGAPTDLTVIMDGRHQIVQAELGLGTKLAPFTFHYGDGVFTLLLTEPISYKEEALKRHGLRCDAESWRRITEAYAREYVPTLKQGLRIAEDPQGLLVTCENQYNLKCFAECLKDLCEDGEVFDELLEDMERGQSPGPEIQ